MVQWIKVGLGKLKFGVLFVFLSTGLIACETTKVNEVEPEQRPPPTPILALDLCPKLRISNAPPADANRRVKRASALACVNGIELMVAPAPNACLTSAFGPRNNRFHSGLDYQSKPAGPVVAAADGTLVIPPARPSDFGQWLIIDHGNGVVSSYSHLASLQRNLSSGQTVKMGDRLGVMGNSGAAARAVHLHYEVRSGRFDPKGNPSKYFLLEKIDPFSKPGRC